MGERKKCTVSGRNASKPTTRRYWAMGVYRKRRIARIERHIRENPNDLQAPVNLKRIEAEVFAPKPDVLERDYRLPGTKGAGR